MNKVIKEKDAVVTKEMNSSELSSVELRRLNAQLAHHGVPGMKWGVRKERSSGSSSSSASSSSSSSQKQVSGKQKRKEMLRKRSSMSDEDLKKAVDRLQMEKRLKDLAQEDLTAGRKTTSTLLATIGTQILTTAASNIGSSIGGDLGKRVIDKNYFIDALKNKSKKGP